MNALRGCTQAMHDNGLCSKWPHYTTGERLKTKESSLCFREDLLLPIQASLVSAYPNDVLHDARQRIALYRQLMSYVTKESSLCFREDLLLPIQASPVSAYPNDALQMAALYDR